MTFKPDILGAEVIPTTKFKKGRPRPVIGVVQHYTASLSERGLVTWMPQSANSAHIFIFRDGHVVQMVSFADQAYHAGDNAGLWLGKPQPANVNSFTIGIENCNVGWLLKGKDGKFYMPKFEAGKPVTLGTLYQGPAPQQAKGSDGAMRWWEPYSDKLVASNIAVMKRIVEMYPAVTRTNIVFHSDVSPKRKTDPGPLWPHQYVLGEVFGSSKVAAPVLATSKGVEAKEEVISDVGRGNNIDASAEEHYDYANEMSMIDPVEDGMCIEK